jgi:hypothetical protein
MRSHRPNAGLRLLLVAALAFIPTASCSDGPAITSGDSGGGIDGLTKGKKKKKKSEGDISLDENGTSKEIDSGDLSDGGETSKELGGPSGSGDAPADQPPDTTEAPAQPPPPIVYPTFDFNGKGACTCKGKVHTTLAKIKTQLDDNNLNINMYYADMILNGKSKGQKQATEKISQNTGITSYVRVPKAEVKPLKDSGFDYATYAIFAKSVTKQRQGQTYNFDKPLPVFPWPAVASRYKALADAPNKTKSWSANVTGFHTFPVTISLTLLEATAEKITVALHTEIGGDNQGNLYEDFPIARDSVYTINPAALLVTRIDATNLFFGDECNKSLETIKMAYLICQRDSEGKVDQFPCAQ